MLVILYLMVVHFAILPHPHKTFSMNQAHTRPSLISRKEEDDTPGRCDIAVDGYFASPFLRVKASGRGGLLSHIVEKSINRFARVL